MQINDDQNAKSKITTVKNRKQKSKIFIHEHFNKTYFAFSKNKKNKKYYNKKNNKRSRSF